VTRRPGPVDARDSVRARIVVRGRVQGVWYRGSAQEEARRLGLVGWARNRPDGSVEILAQGAPAALDRFVEWCREGPPLARVRSVDRIAEAIPAVGADDLAELRDFEVR
jgi:acylphosphatase